MDIDDVAVDAAMREFRVTSDGVGTYVDSEWCVRRTCIEYAREYVRMHTPFPENMVCKVHTVVDFKPIPLLYGDRVMSDIEVELGPHARIERGFKWTHATVHYDPSVPRRLFIPTMTDIPGVEWDPSSMRDEYIVGFRVIDVGPLQRELCMQLIYAHDSSAYQHYVDTYQPKLKRILAYHDAHATRTDFMYRIHAQMHDHASADDLAWIRDFMNTVHYSATCVGRDVSIDVRACPESETLVRDVLPILKTRLRIRYMDVQDYWRFEVKSNRSDVMFAIMHALDDKTSYYREHTHNVMMQIPEYTITGDLVDMGYVPMTPIPETHPVFAIPYSPIVNHLRFKIERVSDSVIMTTELQHPVVRETHIRGIYDLIARIAHDTTPSSKEVREVKSKIEAFRIRG